MRRMLESLGYDVLVAGTRDEALAIAYVRAVSVVVADWNLQDGTAEALLELARRLHPKCRRVVLSGTSAEHSGYDGDAVDMWLLKPVSLAGLRAAFRKPQAL